MRRIILYFLLSFLLTAESVYSQTTIKPTFFSLKNKYEFTLPQFDVSLPLPPNAGFLVPRFSGKNIKLEMDDVTCYYFDPSYLSNPNSFVFQFALESQEKKDLLRMHIREVSRSEIEEEVKTKIAEGKYERLKELKTKLGKTCSFRWASKEGQFMESHIVFKEEHAYTFSLIGNMEKGLKDQYLEIIKGFKEKIQPYLKVRYETRVKNGEFEPKEKKPAPPKPKENNGVLTASSFFQWNDYGYGVCVPEDWEYKVDGNLMSTEENRTEVTLEKASLGSYFITMNWFRSDDMALTLRDYSKMDLAEIINGQAKMARYRQDVDIVVDGQRFSACFYGSKEFGNLDFGFESKGKFHWVSFSGVTQATLPLVEQMLSTMKIDNGFSKDMNMIMPSLSAQLKLDDLSPLKLDEPLSMEHDWPKGNLHECLLTGLNVMIKLPGKEGDYVYRIKDSDQPIQGGVIRELPQNDTDRSLTIKPQSLFPLSYSIAKKKHPIPSKKHISALQRGWPAYEHSEFIHGSITHFNGLEWCVCILRSDKTFLNISTCYVGNYEITIYTHSSSKEEAIRSVAALKNVFYKGEL